MMPTLEDVDAYLRSLDFSALSSTAYVQDYADNYAAHSRDAASQFSRLLAASGDAEGLCCMDIGCGLGVLALLLHWVGAKQVLAVDWDTDFVDGARELARRAGASVEVVRSGADETLAAQRAPIDVAFSLSFIEHVYDLEHHFQSVFGCLVDGGIYVASTGVSGLHIPTMLHYGPSHVALERGGLREAGRRQGFRHARYEMIRQASPDMEAVQARALARRTRGWAGDELLATARSPQSGSTHRRVPWWNVNTCDPRNGNWPDRLMSPRTVVREMHDAGFDARLLPPAQLPPSSAPASLRRRVKSQIGRLAPGPLPFLVATGFTVVGRKPVD